MQLAETALQKKDEGSTSAEIGWRNVHGPEAIVQATSYTGEQTEVSDIYDGLARTGWPDVWYELVQGAFEYNDWKKGPPDIYITFHDGEVVTLATFLQTWEKSRKKVARVQVKNYIDGGAGLRPSNTYLTEHQSKENSSGQDGEKRGRHGRGLKSAVTAIVAHQLARAVCFESYTPDLGSWYAEASMTADKMDKTASPHYQVAACFTNQEQLQETVITIEEPSDLLLMGLFELPEWFIPLNAAYQFSPHYNFVLNENKQSSNLTTLPPFVELEQTDAQQDELVASASAENIAYREKMAQYSPEELEVLQRYTGSRRAEILSPRLFKNGESESKEGFNWIVVDGWKVELNGTTRLANIYAFSGWGDSDDAQRIAERSHNSKTVNGNFSELIVDALCFCHDPQVFYAILSTGLTNGSCYEWDDLARKLYRRIRSFPEAFNALKSAFAQFLIIHQYYKKFPLYLAASNEEEVKAKQYGLTVLSVRSSLWTSLLVDDEKILSLSSFFEIQAKKAEEENEEIRRSLGISTPATSTGEMVRIRECRRTETEYGYLMSEMVELLVQHKGKLHFDASTGRVQIDFPLDFFKETPHALFDLIELYPTLKRLFGLFSDTAFAILEVEANNTPIYFTFTLQQAEGAFSDDEMRAHKGDLLPTEKEHITFKFGLRQSFVGGKIAEEEKQTADELNGFIQALLKEITPLLKPDGSISIEKYQESQWASHNPEKAALHMLRRELQEVEQTLSENLQIYNAMRAAMNLKPLSKDEFSAMLESKNRRKQSRVGAVTKPILETSSGKKIGTFPNWMTFSSSNQTEEKDGLIETLRGLGRRKKARSKVSFGSFSSRLNADGEKQELVGKDVQTKESWWKTWQSILIALFEEKLHLIIKPDVTFNTGPFSREAFTDYFLRHIDSDYSEISIEDYLPLPTLPKGKRTDSAWLRLNKPSDETGVIPVECPYGCEPVGYYCPDKSVTIHFSGMREKGVFACWSEKGFPKNTTFYFKPIEDFGDTSLPDEAENSTKLIEDNLEPYWQNLIAALRTSNMTDKQKVDVLLRAWKKSQIWLDTQQVFDQYSGLGGYDLITQIANYASGDCGYLALGFIGLVSTLFPTRKLHVGSPDNESFNIKNTGHALMQVYLDNRWVTIEAQANYVDKGYQIEPIPEEYQEEFEALLFQVPTGMISSLDGMNMMERKEKRKRPTVGNLTIATVLLIAQKLGLNATELAHKLEILEKDTPELNKIDTEMIRDLVLSAVMAGLMTYPAKAFYDELITFGVTLEQAMAEGMSKADFFTMLHQNGLIVAGMEVPTTGIFLSFLALALCFQVGGARIKYISEINRIYKADIQE